MDLADIDPALLSTLQGLERQKRRMRSSCSVGALNRSLSDPFEQDPTSSPPKALARSRSLLDLRNPAKTPPKKGGDQSSGSDRSQLNSGRTTSRSYENSEEREQRRLQQDFLDRRAAWYKSCSARISPRSTKSKQLTLRVSCPARAPSPTARARAGSDLTPHDGAKRRVSMSLIYGVPYTHVLRMLDCALVFLVGAVLYCSASVRW